MNNDNKIEKIDNNNFNEGIWQTEINVRNFIINNVKNYDGDDSFLEGPSEDTIYLWDKVKSLLVKEIEDGVLSIDTENVSTITSHGPGFIDKIKEKIFGLQTDEPLKRAVKPFGGIRIVEDACKEYGYQLSPKISEIFSKFRKTHNDGVFDAYTPEMRKLRSTGIITGLPDAYARGRIIGDYRRLALYGVDKLIENKIFVKNNILLGEMSIELIQLREEISEQIKALEEIKTMAKSYGFDVSVPAKNSQEAIQWTYFAYLAALKEQDGAAMSLGNVSNFFDVFIEKDLQENKINEKEAQELIDHFIMKLRLVRHLRPNAYNKLFGGDPTWITEAIGGLFTDGRHKITKTSYRFLQTLYNLGPSPEPNLTILWSDNLPENFKKFCCKVSIDTSSLQYENDDLMRKTFNSDDYGIACCVSHMTTGKTMQFFGARCNLAKALLLSLNSGYDELKHIKIVEGITDLKSSDILKYEDVKKNLKIAIKHLAATYVNTMNVIHYMHDKYYYEKAQMAMMDVHVKRNMAFGLAGLSVVADSLSAIKYAKVKPVRDKDGFTTNFEVIGDYPKFGNDDNRVDDIAKQLVIDFENELRKHHIYRNAEPTLSILTITSNVVYGEKTGATPDGRKKGEAFAPGANPMHGREKSGVLSSLNSVSKIPYEYAKDGISNTFSIIPKALGNDVNEQIENLINILNGYFIQNGHHLNVNVLNKETLIDAMRSPEKYSQLTIRVSGYAVNFVRLSKQQQEEVLLRTFFDSFIDNNKAIRA